MPQQYRYDMEKGKNRHIDEMRRHEEEAHGLRLAAKIHREQGRLELGNTLSHMARIHDELSELHAGAAIQHEVPTAKIVKREGPLDEPEVRKANRRAQGDTDDETNEM